MAMDTARLREISGLLDAMDVQVGIVGRRLLKSGPGHYARARFDALDYIVRTQFIDVEQTGTDAPSALRNRFQARVRCIDNALEAMAADYEELDPVHFPRNEKNRYRSERLIDDILVSVGLRRRGVDLDASIYEGRAAARNRALGPVQDGDAAIYLKGNFGSKRTAE